MNVPNYEAIRRLNAITKLRALAKENGVSEADTEEMIKNFLAKIKSESKWCDFGFKYRLVKIFNVQLGNYIRINELGVQQGIQRGI